MRILRSGVATLAAWGALAADGGPAAGSAPDAGAALYARHCLTCHQADGYGVPNLQPAIVGGQWVKGDARALALFVMTGGFNSAERKESDSHNVMPAFAHLTDTELAELLTYVRRKFGDSGSAITAAEVGEVRATLPARP
jgi:mono/diheme cytochrome c family protein